MSVRETGELRRAIEQLYAEPPDEYGPESFALFDRLKQALNRGLLRAAEPDHTSPTGWRVNAWVKQGILVGFRMGKLVDMTVGGSPGRRRL